MSRDIAELVSSVGVRLRKRGERMTEARRAVLVALATTPGHLTADDIHARAGADLPASSVYRALEALSGVGVVQHIHLGHGATAYHLTEGDDAHVHLQCRSCGAVLDLPAEILDPVAAYVARAGFELDPTHTALSGSCAACR
ncbi:Fur family transcriptional regulator [Nostocoides australiense]